VPPNDDAVLYLEGAAFEFAFATYNITHGGIRVYTHHTIVEKKFRSVLRSVFLRRPRAVYIYFPENAFSAHPLGRLPADNYVFAGAGIAYTENAYRTRYHIAPGPGARPRDGASVFVKYTHTHAPARGHTYRYIIRAPSRPLYTEFPFAFSNDVTIIIVVDSFFTGIQYIINIHI